ncbi:MAG TPA: hypothetical protein VFT22_11495 [Kofleriaceae bacterium]|nr:hypothetical protein [Kofleriaceae bacterium]
MAKKQTRRSISVSRTTYERLKAFCETNHISMSQLVETRVNDFLGAGELPAMTVLPSAPIRPAAPIAPRPIAPALQAKPVESKPAAPVAAAPSPAPAAAPAQPVPMTSAAVRIAVEPPPPIIKPRQDTAAPKPAEKRPEQIFTF